MGLDGGHGCGGGGGGGVRVGVGVGCADWWIEVESTLGSELVDSAKQGSMLLLLLLVS